MAAIALILLFKLGFATFRGEEATASATAAGRQPLKGLKKILETIRRQFQQRPFLVYLIPILIILLYFAPYILKGENVHVKIFDVLDAWLPQTKILAESGKAFSLNPETRIDNVMDGLRLSGFNSGYNVATWLFMLFPPFVAYTLNMLITAFVAFWGMALLLRRFILVKEEHKKFNWLVMGTALCFSLITFYPPAGLSIAGFPLLLYFFLKIRNGEVRKRDFIYIIFFPFYSLLHHAGIFIILVLGVLFLYDLIREWLSARKEQRKGVKINWSYIIALGLLCIFYGFTHFHLIHSFIAPQFTSHREEIVIQPLNAAKCLEGTVHNFIFDRTNIVSGQNLIVLLSAAWALILGLSRGVGQTSRRLLIFILLAAANAFLWGFKYWQGIHFLRENFHFFTAFNFARFYWLNPVVWYLIFGLSLAVIARMKRGKTFVSWLIVAQLLFLFTAYNVEYRHKLKLPNRLHSSLTYKQFYSEALYKKINDYIGKPQKDYYTISIGLQPAVANYNGFYTLDAYATIYSIEYKHKFRRIMERELAKSSTLQKVFDENGKRCYIFISDLFRRPGTRGIVFARGITKHDSHFKIKKMDLNTAAFKEMGGEYIFSAVKIGNFAENGLAFENVFQTQDSPWRVYLYRVL